MKHAAKRPRRPGYEIQCIHRARQYARRLRAACVLSSIAFGYGSHIGSHERNRGSYATLLALSAVITLCSLLRTTFHVAGQFIVLNSFEFETGLTTTLEA